MSFFRLTSGCHCRYITAITPELIRSRDFGGDGCDYSMGIGDDFEVDGDENAPASLGDGSGKGVT
jgi:hypothetical protein